MRLYEYFGNGSFHTSVVTTFGVDFDAYENIMLARFRGAGCHNNMLLADSRMLSLALDGASSLPRHAGRVYSVMGVSPPGVFHPKITLQIGRKAGRLLVGSANATSAGLAGNLEVAGLIDCDTDESNESRMVAAAWQFARRFINDDNDREGGIRHQMEWMSDRSSWLLDSEPTAGIVTMRDDSRAGFLTTGRTYGIARQFLEAIGDEKAKRLIVISPYWDNDLATLHLLIERTGAADCFVLIDRGRHFFPAHALAAERDVKLLDFKADDTRRYVHAKAVIVQTEQADHILYGSANCTFAALGNWDFAGLNEEASFYRALAPDAALSALGLTDALNSTPLGPEAFADVNQGEDIPLAALGLRYPGRFICKFDALTWHPPAELNAQNMMVELLDANGAMLSHTPKLLSHDRTEGIKFGLPVGVERPFFARVRQLDGNVSAPAIVLVLDLLRAALRDARSKRMDVALAQLDGETDIGLWLLETLNDIETAESVAHGPAAPKRRQRPADSAEGQPPTYRLLGYEDFVAGRQLRSDSAALSRDSLGTSDLSQIRAFLNRVLSFETAATDEVIAPEDGSLAQAFDLGDEVSDAMNAIEGGADFTVVPKTTTDIDEAERAKRHKVLQRRANKLELIDAVAKLQQQVSAKAKGGHLTSVDVLRLRAMMMITAAAGWNGSNPSSNVLQVLPTSGDVDGSWPRLLGKCLFSYFGGAAPAIKMLKIEDYYDQIPDDILECWASCLWSIQAILYACQNLAGYRPLMGAFQKLSISIYTLIGLRQSELMDERVFRCFDSLSNRFETPLGLDRATIVSSHKRFVASIRLP